MGDLLELLDTVPSLSSDAGVQSVGGRLLAAGPGDKLHVFEDAEGNPSEVAARILELVDGRRSVRVIVETLSEEFEVDPEVCSRDTAVFVQRLANEKLLVLSRPQ